VSFGLVLGGPVSTGLNAAQLLAALSASAYAGVTGINADPFVAYTAENPSDYKIGKYAGITIVYVPARGFAAIVFNVIVNQFVNT
jgi:hypothetical protein